MILKRAILLSLVATSCASTPERKISVLDLIPTPPPVEIVQRIYSADQIDVEFGNRSCRVRSWGEAFGYLGQSVQREYRIELHKKGLLQDQPEDAGDGVVSCTPIKSTVDDQSNPSRSLASPPTP